ncbi:hypothetical protein Bbelb_248220 [Branchiostoma belcheri]|nr:hypothetical protein Bbelb_248220 [Branchiostoma belcheri]
MTGASVPTVNLICPVSDSLSRQCSQKARTPHKLHRPEVLRRGVEGGGEGAAGLGGRATLPAPYRYRGSYGGLSIGLGVLYGYVRWGTFAHTRVPLEHVNNSQSHARLHVTLIRTVIYCVSVLTLASLLGQGQWVTEGHPSRPGVRLDNPLTGQGGYRTLLPSLRQTTAAFGQSSHPTLVADVVGE